MNGRFLGGSERRSPAKVPTPAIVAVGSMIDSMCGKCKRATSHRVTRKIGVQPTLLACTVCAAEHAYKSPAASARAKKRREETLANAVPMDPAEAWTRAMKRASGPPIAYSMAGHFPVGQRLSHSAFGDGVVTRRATDTVCTVIFQSGEKRLVMGSPSRPSQGESES